MKRFIQFSALALILLAGVAVACIYLAPGPTTRLFVNIERARSGLAKHEVTLTDGTRIVYLEGGKGAPLLLLHGFGDDKDNFVYVARSLVHDYHLVIPDINGFGESSRPTAANYGMADQVARLRGLAQALQLGPLHIGGSSMGGQIALVYAASYPQEVKSLWLLDPGGLKSAPPSDLSHATNPTPKDAKKAFDAEVDAAMSDPPLIPKPMLDYIGEERAKNKDTEALISRSLSAEPGLEPRITGLATPSLIVWGAQDHMINPATADILHGLLPHSQLIIMPGVGHLPMLEQPEKSAADYLAFRTQLVSGVR